MEQEVQKREVKEQENVTGQQKSSTEFKVGAGVLSGIGILFVLIGFVILVKNYMPPFVQGMLMLTFFAVIWLCSRLFVFRLSEKLSLGLSCASMVGLYLSAVVNYHIFQTMPLYLAVGILALIGIISWADAFLSRSALLSCMSFGGYLLFALFLPWGETIPEFCVMMAVTLGINLLWHFGAAGERRELIRVIHGACFALYSIFYGIVLMFLQPEGGLTCVLIYMILVVILLNFFYSRNRNVGLFCVWLCGSIFQISLLMGILLGIKMTHGEMDFLLLLIPAGINLLLLFWRKFQWHWQGLFYQTVVLVFLVAVEKPIWPGMAASLVLFGAGLLMIREKRLLHELVMSFYFYIYLAVQLQRPWIVPAQLACLLAITVLCLYVPRLRSKKGAPLVYTNISLMGLSLLMLLGERNQANYVSNTVVLVLAVASVMILWRERCYLSGKLRGLMLVLALTYMVFIYQITLPVMVSILLMGVALVSIVAGFIRREAALRIFGLCMALFVCVKVIVYDFWGLALLPKSILLMVVGMAAIAIAVVYAILEQKQKRMKIEEQQEEKEHETVI